MASIALMSATIVAPLGLASSNGPGGPSSATRPSALWKAFPLRVAPSRSLVPPRSLRPAVPAHTATLPAVVRSPGSSRTVLLAAAGLSLLLVAAAGAAFLVLRGPAGRWSRAVSAAISQGRLLPSRPHTLSLAIPLQRERSYVLVLPGRRGWGDRLFEREGAPPSLGEVIFDDDLGRAGQAYVVKVVGRSPLPGDKRSCAILHPL